MPTNDFLPFAVTGGGSANVETQTDYVADSILRADGFQGGVAPSAKFNKIWRQATILAWAVAQLISDRLNANVQDNGDTATLLAQLKNTIGNGSAALTYSASMTPDASTAWRQIVTAVDGVAFAINAPTNATADRVLAFTIRNTSGGVLGAVTWNAVFKMAAWSQPANGFSRTITFQFNGTNWIELSRTPADVPN